MYSRLGLVHVSRIQGVGEHNLQEKGAQLPGGRRSIIQLKPDSER